MMKAGLFRFFLLALVVLPIQAFSATPPDPAAILVGTWRGELDPKGGRWNPQNDKTRILIIESVKKHEKGDWVVDAAYAEPKDGAFDKVFKPSLEVGSKTKFEFLTPGSKTEVKLTLSDEPPWILTGSMMTRSGVFGLELKKISDTIAKKPE
jgi:hypothetical protein